MNEGAKAGGIGQLELAPWPNIDHSIFGPVESVPMSRIQKFVSATLARNWVMIPHVTHHEEADISALAEVRTEASELLGTKVSPLPFMMKAAVVALQAFPKFNASMDVATNTLVLKKYYHIGFAVDTPNGLVVPVIRDVDKKTIGELSSEISDLSSRARGKGLPMNLMQGGSFTISSLGSFGGTGFTPIINAPEVAILGATRSFEKPVREGDHLAWRTMLPLSLSYDHRVINGADAARFCLEFAKAISNARGFLAAQAA